MAIRREKDSVTRFSDPVCESEPALSFGCVAFRCEMQIVEARSPALAALKYASENPEKDADGKEVQHKIGDHRDIAVVVSDGKVEVIRFTFGWGVACNRTHIGDEVECPTCGSKHRVP